MLIKPKYDVIIFLKYLIIFSCEMGLAFHTVFPVCKLHHLNEMSLNSKNWVRDKSGLGFEKPYGEQVPPTPRAWTWLDLLGIVKPKKVGKGLCTYVTIHRPTPHMTISLNTHQLGKWDPNPVHFFNFPVHSWTPISWLSIVKQKEKCYVHNIFTTMLCLQYS